MKRLELTVYKTNGTARTMRSERNDAMGRRTIDKAALYMVTWHDVDHVEVHAVDRTAGR